MRPPRLLLPLFLITLLLSSPTAEAQQSDPSPASTALENKIRLTRPKQLALGTVTGIGAIAATTLLSVGTLQLCDRRSEACEVGSLMFIPLSGLVLLPASVAGSAQWLGRRHDVHGSYLRAWGYGALGMVGGTAAGLLVGVAAGPFAAIPAALVLASFGTAIGAVRGYNIGARKRAALPEHLSPNLSTTQDNRGVMLSLRGAF